MSNMDSRNLAHVRAIAQKIDDISAGLVYYCEDCEEEIVISPQDEECEVDTCPHCGGQLTPMTFDKYFDDPLGIEYRTFGKNQDINSVKICVAWGGPAIYVDTADAKVKLFWWRDYAEAEFSTDASNEITDLFNEYWSCQ